MTDTNAVVSFLDFSLSLAINIKMVNIVHACNRSENSGLLKINDTCLNGCNSKGLKIEQLFITSISSGFCLQVFSFILCMHKPLPCMVVAAHKQKGMLKI